MIIKTYSEDERDVEKANINDIMDQLDDSITDNAGTVVINLDETSVTEFADETEMTEYLHSLPEDANTIATHSKEELADVEVKIAKMCYALDYPDDEANYNFMIDYNNFTVHEFSHEKALVNFNSKDNNNNAYEK